METEVFERFQRARQPVKVMRRLGKIASRKIERHRFQVLGLQALAETDLERIVGLQPLFDFVRFGLEIA